MRKRRNSACSSTHGPSRTNSRSGCRRERSGNGLPLDGRIILAVTTRRAATVLAIAVFVAVAASAASARAPTVGAIAPGVPLLRDAFALGTLIRIDPKSGMAEFRISCGWYYAPRRKLRAGVWKVRLPGLTFDWERNLGNPRARLHPVEAVSLTTWERRAERGGWSGTLRLGNSRNLSNGPTTDICAGIAG